MSSIKQRPVDMPVMPAKCHTCPFGKDGNPELQKSVLERNLKLNSSQLCHHTRLNGKPETHLCRGMRDVQLQIFYGTGFLEQPTDAAWESKVLELGLRNANGK